MMSDAGCFESLLKSSAFPYAALHNQLPDLHSLFVRKAAEADTDRPDYFLRKLSLFYMTREPDIAETGEKREPEKSGKAAAPTHPGPPKSIVREYFEQLVVTFIMALFLMTFIAQAVQVPTGSMQNTINIGDQLFVNKFIFGRNTPVIGSLLPAREIRRGDIIVFKLPHDPKTNYVKRVIGLPGEEILVKGTTVLISGKPLPEKIANVRLECENCSALPELGTPASPPDAQWKVFFEEREGEESGEESRITHGMKYGIREAFKIPAGQYFVMGDSRDNSLDSRYWGTVPRDNIIARALYVHWSFNWNESRKVNWGRLGTAVK
jgi:signal peptidase I